jgi:hypothetical protein
MVRIGATKDQLRGSSLPSVYCVVPADGNSLALLTISSPQGPSNITTDYNSSQRQERENEAIFSFFVPFPRVCSIVKSL